MSREKRTRPSVGALGRAVETGSAMQADTTSKPQFTLTAPVVNGKLRIFSATGARTRYPAGSWRS